MSTVNEARIQEYLNQHAKLCQTRVASAEEKTLDKIVGTIWKLMTKEEKKEAERRLKQNKPTPTGDNIPDRIEKRLRDFAEGLEKEAVDAKTSN